MVLHPKFTVVSNTQLIYAKMLLPPLWIDCRMAEKPWSWINFSLQNHSAMSQAQFGFFKTRVPGEKFILTSTFTNSYL